MPAPVIPSISDNTIPLVHFDDLPITDFDCYYLILSICSYFWNINKWPISKKNISDKLTNIENLYVGLESNIQEKSHNMYYYGWVIMQTRKKILKI